VPVKTWISGPGLERFSPEIQGKLQFVDKEFWHPNAESLLILGLAKYHQGEWGDLWKIEPLYLRPSSAEEQWKK
jgi:tRNA A37 threonylcarbamoyladenosine modification protein TsaB